MIAVDSNILVYAHRVESPFHAAAARCVAELANGMAPWAIPWPCVHEFLAVVTNPRVYSPPTPLARALEQVDAWLESPTVMLLAEGPMYWQELRPLLHDNRVAGGMVHDAKVVALCQQHGIRTLWSADRDFSRFGRFAVSNPLVD